MDFDQLLQQPESRRDENWEREFLNQFSMTKVQIVNERPSEGPDGWPYLNSRTGGDEPIAKVVHWLSSRGIGLAVNTHKMVPDYVFTYGMLWNFKETGRFVTDSVEKKPGEVVLDGGMVTGAPTEKYLPAYVRRILKEFLAAQGFKKPRIVVLSSADYKIVDLAFSVDSLGALPEKEHKVLADALSWFLPLHYSLVFASEDGLQGWVDL